MKGFQKFLSNIIHNFLVSIAILFIFTCANVASFVCCAGLYFLLTAMFGSIDVVANLTGPEIATMTAMTIHFIVIWVFCAWCAAETMEFS